MNGSTDLPDADTELLPTARAGSNFSRTFVCLAIGTTYSMGSKGQKFCVVLSENAPLQS